MTDGHCARRAHRFAMGVACAAAICAGHSLAQPLPIDAGRIQEQLRAPEVPKKPAVAPQIRIEPPPGDAKADTPPFYVASFRVTGATAYNAPSLVRLLGEAGRPMTLREVQERAERITKAYKDQGYVVARAVVPAQDVRDGVVEVRVIEGRYERIDISNASDMSESHIRSLLGSVRENALVHGPTLERAVLLISDLAGVQPKATLEPGAQPGTTNLTLEIVPTKSVEYDLTVDNAGSSFTGKNRLTLGATLNSPNDIGDRAGVRLVTSGRRLNSARLAYDRPLGTDGVRGNLFLSHTTYSLGEQFKSLEATGTARAWGGGAMYPWLRTAQFNFRLIANGEYRELEDRIASLDIINEKSAHMLQWGAGGDLRDDRGAIPKLNSPLKDIQEIGKIYRDQFGYEVRTLPNADKATIVRALNRLILESGPNDSVTVFYAGHGQVIEKTGRGYWIPARASADDPTQWISNQDIGRALENIPARQVLLVSDSCYSGTLTRDAKLQRDEVLADPARVLERRSVTVLSSGGEEPVADAGRDGHSVFAWHYMQALRGVEKWANGIDVHGRLAESVSKEFPQEPQYGEAAGSGHQRGGDFLFEVRRY